MQEQRSVRSGRRDEERKSMDVLEGAGRKKLGRKEDGVSETSSGMEKAILTHSTDP